ncbi:hypothetical protein KJK34_11685 [Flavobacterium sp. D11R37]|uniref:hypothetical protein n=1 Tax=Flavobacterium coralii TaxID=2838017 RepID=UPI001CA7AB38|nr:hypothetical protein [Flavobacterium coralii]MBY8963415.1 hypothetical protein [Flavobacterium coralii]
MKNLLLMAGMALLLVSCSEDSESPLNNDTPSDNKVLLLKVDFETNVFEGGKELTFEDAEGFTITSDYNSPGDFGDITLMYEEANDTIFAGDIVWAGLGQMTYPESLADDSAFASLPDALPMPSLQHFEIVEYDEYAYYPEVIDHEALWAAVDNLQVVKEYRESNPDANIRLFLYTPSVGVGNPAEWDWFIILKN